MNRYWDRENPCNTLTWATGPTGARIRCMMTAGHEGDHHSITGERVDPKFNPHQ